METIITRNNQQFVEYGNFLEFIFDDCSFDQAEAVKIRTDGKNLIIACGRLISGVFQANEAAAYPLEKIAEPLSLTMPAYDALIDETYYSLPWMYSLNQVECCNPAGGCHLE